MGSNYLSNEKSPYLLQHKDNPVWWDCWGERAFARARDEDKPIFLSIGYSTCHWCHVMEHESFEDEGVAQILNENFVSIKLDREERPDVDQIYMDAVQAMGVRGGWPLSVFLTPDLVPFYGGTYYPKKHFVLLLNEISKKWREEKKGITDFGDKLRAHLDEHDQKSAERSSLHKSVFHSAVEHMNSIFDSTWGGFGSAPKFPPSMKLRFLLRVASKQSQEEKMVFETLEQMYRGGMYDHVAGGFHRYSVDEKWLVPHFEKMLYDNASLAMTYLEAFQYSKKPLFERVSKDILNYVLREMTASNGGFFSAQDADAEGVEGKFHVWDEDEISKTLSASEFELAQKNYGITRIGNFEGKNILNLQTCDDLERVWDEDFLVIKSKLRKRREKRVAPLKDDKIITSWNGLMISAMAKAAQVFGDSEYERAAVSAAEFIRSNLWKGGALKRRFRQEESRFDATLEDYAYLIEGLIHLYETTFEEKWLLWASELQQQQDQFFWSEDHGSYFFARESNDLFHRKVELGDDACPNPNGVSVLNLLRLSGLLYQDRYRDRATEILERNIDQIRRFPPYYAQTLIGLNFLLSGSKEVALVGPKSDEILDILRTNFLPNQVVAYASETGRTSVELLKDKKSLDGKTTAYVCSNRVCRKPVTDGKGLAQELGLKLKR